MSLPAPGIDPAVQRMLAGELAKSLWATAKPAATDSSDGDSTGAGGLSSGADTYSSLFTDVLADAMAPKSSPRRLDSGPTNPPAAPSPDPVRP